MEDRVPTIITIRALIIVSVLLLSACSTSSTLNKSSKNAQSIKSNVAKSTVAINLKSLGSIASIAPELAKHKVVFVGESHTSYSDHLNQLAVIQNLHQRWGNRLSIGLEMIQQPYQPFLDKYISGSITEREMLKGAQWYSRWVYDFRLYRPIFDYAKKHRIPLVALNISKELTRRITKVGINGLSPAERKQLPAVVDRSNKAYSKRLKDVFGGHMRTSSKGFEKFMDAQLAWDEGMAFNATNYLKKHPSSNMVVLAGGGHVINREGIPDRLDRQNQSTSAVVLNSISTMLNSTQGDYLLDSKEVKLAPAGLMGIFMDDTKKGLTVKKLSKESAAKEAGVKTGDLIVSLNNQVVRSVSDVKLWGLDKKPNDKAVIKVNRNGKIYQYRFQLKGPSKKSMHQLKPHK